MGFFLSLQCIVLICYVVAIIVVESNHFSTRGKKKSNLWRVILPCCTVACLGILFILSFIHNSIFLYFFHHIWLLIIIFCIAKVIRLGLLANPATRHSVGQVGLLFVYNTHLCFCTIGFITLLFFWYVIIRAVN